MITGVSLFTDCGTLLFADYNTLQIYDKLSYEELNRHFCQTAVSGWASLFFVC